MNLGLDQVSGKIRERSSNLASCESVPAASAKRKIPKIEIRRGPDVYLDSRRTIGGVKDRKKPANMKELAVKIPSSNKILEA